ncbi:EamA family transporter [Nocardioides zeae]|uniref:EamA family transporter n=1 Tax=Nocardioides imazamoxiresistens TaxID=3231893 RepID=A0ABU3PZR0_9ACTN|nr:EamA family transporter [Nocardioides zeae]MDT9594676.1 EamA family transporter [Nocardioides zeae]
MRRPDLQAALVTAVAPVAWGSTYYVTRQFLPADAPLWGAAVRAVPAGLVLLAVARALPRGSWWWRAGVLGVLNVGVFFLLVYVAAQRLPSSIAAVVMAAAPLVMAAMAWALHGDRPRARAVAAAVVGLVGVVLVVEGARGEVDALGLGASLAALLSSSLGFVLARRWSAVHPVPVVASTAWQLLAGGGALVVVAAVADGAPPVPSAVEAAAFAYVSLVATALAFVCWFVGLARLDVASVGVVGLLNPVTGVLLGTLLAAEHLSLPQLVGVAVVLGAVAVATGRSGRAAGPRAETGSSVATGAS